MNKSGRFFTVLLLLVCMLLLLPANSAMAADDDPAAPNLDQTILRSPGVDATVYGGRPTFKWYPVDDATVYDLEMFDSAMVSMGLWNKGIGACDPGPFCEHRISTDLQSNFGDYYWRVRARNTVTSDIGDWSVTRKFTYTRLERTAQVSPPTGTVTDDTSPTLQWTDITGATMYLMQIRNMSDKIIIQTLVPDATFCDGSICTWDVSPELAFGEYKWHVRAKNGRNFGRWTAYRTIEVVENLPNTVRFDFLTEDELTDWVDPFDLWELSKKESYAGSTGTCDFNCGFTYYDADYSDAVFESSVRSTGADYDVGFSLYLRTQFDVSGAPQSGYRLYVYQSGTTAVTVTLYRIYPTNDEYIGFTYTVLTGFNIADYHTYRLEVSGDAFELFIGSQSLYALSDMDDALTIGKFGFDVAAVTSFPTVSQVEVDWVEIEDTATP